MVRPSKLAQDIVTSVGRFQKVKPAPPLNDLRKNALANIVQLYADRYTQDTPEETFEEGLNALYERLSQEDRLEGESNSIANQKKILEKYCKDHGYTGIRHYVDDGYSGTNFERPQFQKMLTDIKAGKIKRVIVKDMSRLGRDYLKVGMFTEILFPEYGVHFVAVNDGVDSTRGDNEFAAIRNIFNELYARDTSKKVRATNRQKGNTQGERLTTQPPYGYMKDPANKKVWLVDQEAAAIVQTIFSLCMAGMGPTQIARWLTAQKILTPAAYFIAQGRKTSAKAPRNHPYAWCGDTVAAILSRLEYLGHTVNFKTEKESYKSKKTILKDPSEWVIFENTHEPIIQEGIFFTVQNIRQYRRRPTKLGEMGMFSNLIFCADCGSKMYQCRMDKWEKRQEYFICSGYRKGREVCATTHSIRNVVLEELVLANLRDAIRYVAKHEDEFIERASTFGQCEKEKEMRQKKAELEKIKSRIDELDRLFKKIYEDSLSGRLSEQRYIKLSRDYESEQAGLEHKAEVLQRELKQNQSKKANIRCFTEIAKKYTDLKELDATILREFIEKILVHHMDKETKTQKIQIVYNFIGAFDFQQQDTSNSGGKKKSA